MFIRKRLTVMGGEMLLKDSSGQLFQMRIIGYQFAEDRVGEAEPNRLLCGLIVDNLERRLMLQVPCLYRPEIPKLANWLTSIRDGTVQQPQFLFQDPIVSFHYLEQSLESWLNVFVASGQNKHRVSLRANELDIGKAVATLRSTLIKLPIR